MTDIKEDLSKIILSVHSCVFMDHIYPRPHPSLRSLTYFLASPFLLSLTAGHPSQLTLGLLLSGLLYLEHLAENDLCLCSETPLLKTTSQGTRGVVLPALAMPPSPMGCIPSWAGRQTAMCAWMPVPPFLRIVTSKFGSNFVHKVLVSNAKC